MAQRDPSPRVKLATRLFASGAVATKREAAEAAGLNPSYFSVVTSPTNSRNIPAASQLMEDIDKAIHDRTVETSAVLQLIGREALVKMRGLMNDDGNKAIQFKATQDLLDRSPETSKIQKHAIAGFSLAGEDAKALAAAMVRSAEIRAQYGDAVMSDFVRIPVDPIQDDSEALIHAEQEQLLSPLRQEHGVDSLGAQGCGEGTQAGAADLHSAEAVSGESEAA